ncbi:MAG TPA: amino acid adenylation domain-containing protein [Candidatus Solibacter sp.]|nr:amino acid adenylation domain-containing protein [Candidatus Solibacter sp.]
MAYILQQLLTRSAALYPEKPAVWARKRTLTYRELDQKSTQLAHLLRQRGLKKGDRVGIFFPKCVESLVCMFGVLKAGGVYVPLDPQAPAERIGYIIANCNIRVLLTNKERRAALGAEIVNTLDYCVMTDDSGSNGSGTKIVPWAMLADFAADKAPEVVLTETDLAYILYTSGSTGRPKGVMLSHQNALTFVEWCAAKFQTRPEDRMSNHAPLHFDLSVFDVYNAIEAGATVYLVTEDLALFPTTLANFIEQQQITVWYSVPSALMLLLLHANLKAEKVPHLRTILFAGEVFPMKYLRQLAELLPNVELYNLYGPTETNVCTYYHVERERLEGMSNLPIGIACENTEVFAVNDQDQIITKPGEQGELYVRGPAVTYGYWADAEKTRKMVVPNRFQPNFNENMYRTGDLVTLAEDGNYYFQGRRDSQIKSRGYRIELGEIETALLSHPGVKEAAAVAIPDDLIGNRIKAVVAAHETHALKIADLQQFCATRIPKYMIPEQIEFLETLPKTSTGKIDRVTLAKSSN